MIFLPFTKRVEVEVLLTLAEPPPLPLEKVLLKLLKEVKPPEPPFAENKSSIKLPPKLKPKGLNKCELRAFWG